MTDSDLDIISMDDVDVSLDTDTEQKPDTQEPSPKPIAEGDAPRSSGGDANAAKPEASAHSPPEPFSDDEITFHKALRNGIPTEGPCELGIKGKLPEWLNGFYYTLSPGVVDVKYPKMIEVDGTLEQETRTFSFGHLFDNIPQVHQFAFSGSNNSAKYRSTIPAQRAATKIREHQGYLPNQPSSVFKTATNQSVFARLLSDSHSNGRPGLEPCGASIGILPPFVIDGRRTVYCQNYANHVLELSADTLDKRGILAWDEVNSSFRGAHASPRPHYDPVTKELINFTMEHGYQSTQYHFFSITEEQPHGTLIASVSAKTSHVHTFAVTPRYIILVVSPWNPSDGGVKYSWGASILDALTYRRNEPAMFYIISRIKRRHIATFRSEAFFFLHHVNAFEDAADNVYLDMAVYPDDTIIHQLSLPTLLESQSPPLFPSDLVRFELANVQAEAARVENYNAAVAGASPIDKMRGFIRRVSNSQAYAVPEKNSNENPLANRVRSVPGLEMPRINATYRGLDYKYTWGVALSEGGDGKFFDSIVKVSVQGTEPTLSWSEPLCYPSEAVFVAPPVFDPKEDSGYLISVVYDAEKNASFVLILDAQDLKETARAWLPEIVPLSFASGCFAAGDISFGMQPAGGEFADNSDVE